MSNTTTTTELHALPMGAWFVVGIQEFAGDTPRGVVANALREAGEHAQADILDTVADIARHRYSETWPRRQTALVRR